MDTSELATITNFRRLSDRLITGGMPTEAQLAAVAHAGFEVVINLDQRDSRHGLPDEPGTVAALGMAYVTVPVVWPQPVAADLDAFCAAMDRHAGQPVFVHCVANYRASAFIMLYRVLRLGWRIEDAFSDMRAIWDPAQYPVWQAFIADALADWPKAKA